MRAPGFAGAIAALLADHHDQWVATLGLDVRVRHVVVRDAGAPRDVPAPAGSLTTDAAAAVAERVGSLATATGQEIAGVKHPFDDRDVLAAALEAR